MSTKAVKHIPDGYHTVTAYLTVDDAARAIDFYVQAFAATELYRLPMGDMIGHAEIKIGDTHIMLYDEFASMNVKGPNARGGPTAAFADLCRGCRRRLRQGDQGAPADRAVENQFWGDRMGSVLDPFGHKWSLATHVEDVPPEEMQKRMAAWSAAQGS
ncbi:MAG: VOC family protein [Xanthomonadales bacterium]|nr:VOC family protein [Xanthomonadales bacterium]